MLTTVESLVGSYELTQLLGVKRARVFQISNTDDFPRPAAVLAMGSIWRLDDIKEWAQRKGRTLNLDAVSPALLQADKDNSSPTAQREP
jgi:predicted DNA-binding transcriptional regulator AlpA